MRRTDEHGAGVFVVGIAIVFIVAVGGFYYATNLYDKGQSQTSTSTTCQTGCMVDVNGSVSVGPATPVCVFGQSCSVNMTGYQLDFQKYATCPNGLLCPEYAVQYAAPLSADGDYSISIPIGNYDVSLSSCSWTGCSAVFPAKEVFDAPGNYTLDFDVDTGIR